MLQCSYDATLNCLITLRVSALLAVRVPACQTVTIHLPLASSTRQDRRFARSAPRRITRPQIANEHPPPTPITPHTPHTPAIQSVEREDDSDPAPFAGSQTSGLSKVPTKDPILALRMSRAGHLFAVITATSITLWQTKVRDYMAGLSMQICC